MVYKGLQPNSLKKINQIETKIVMINIQIDP